jgi:hypothetical protein
MIRGGGTTSPDVGRSDVSHSRGNADDHELKLQQTSIARAGFRRVMAGGNITRHVEQGSAVKVDEHLGPTDCSTFMSHFEDFKSQVLFRSGGA